MPPNLFSYATSELSQDAFLCWLLAWADPVHQTSDPALHDVAVAFLDALFVAAGRTPPPRGTSVDVKRQLDHVDVVALLGDGRVLVIEDKTRTHNHSDQLNRYREALGQAHGEEQLVCVYLKTGDASSYADVRAKGWAVFTRRDLLAVLRRGRGTVRNDVFDQFTDHLEGIEAAVARYATAPLDTWDGPAWRGFFQALQEALGEGAWGFVPNPSGGFMGFWWAWQTALGGERVYLQLEERPHDKSGRLVVKTEVGEPARRSEVRDRWVARITSGGPEGFERPKKLGKGRWMTVATHGEFRAENGSGALDMAGTVRTLKRAQDAVQRLVAQVERVEA